MRYLSVCIPPQSVWAPCDDPFTRGGQRPCNECGVRTAPQHSETTAVPEAFERCCRRETRGQECSAAGASVRSDGLKQPTALTAPARRLVDGDAMNANRTRLGTSGLAQSRSEYARAEMPARSAAPGNHLGRDRFAQPALGERQGAGAGARCW